MHKASKQEVTGSESNVFRVYLRRSAAQCLAKNLGGAIDFTRLSIVNSRSRAKNSLLFAVLYRRIIRKRSPGTIDARALHGWAGWCAHGVLAMETAQICREQEQDVALLRACGNDNPEV